MAFSARRPRRACSCRSGSWTTSLRTASRGWVDVLQSGQARLDGCRQRLADVLRLERLPAGDVDMVDVPASAVGEHRHQPLARRPPQGLFQVVRVVGAIERAADRVEVQGEDGQRSQGPAVGRISHQHDAHLRVDRPGGADDVGIAQPGLHRTEPSFMWNRRLNDRPCCSASAGVEPRRPGRRLGVGDHLDELFHAAWPGSRPSHEDHCRRWPRLACGSARAGR